MTKFITFTFLLLGLSFYQLSGGSDFTPEVRQVAPVANEETEPQIATSEAPQTTSISLVELPQIVVEPEVIGEPESAVPVVEAPVVAPEPVQEPEPEPEVIVDLRIVAGSRVNMRTGPSTDFAVVDTLVRGTQVEVLEVNADGWAKLRNIDTGDIGWMGERFLSES